MNYQEQLDNSHVIIGSINTDSASLLLKLIKSFPNFALNNYGKEMNFGEWLDYYSSMIMSQNLPTLIKYLYNLAQNGEEPPKPKFTMIYHDDRQIWGFKSCFSENDFEGYKPNFSNGDEMSYIDTSIVKNWGPMHLNVFGGYSQMVICKSGNLDSAGVSSVRLELLNNKHHSIGCYSSLIINTNNVRLDNLKRTINRVIRST